MSVGKTIRTLRKRKGLTQAELAQKVNVTASLITLYEKDNVVPSVQRFEDILNVMGYELYARPIPAERKED